MKRPNWSVVNAFIKPNDPKVRIERHRARLVPKGFTQIKGIYYKQTFSVVSRNDCFRIPI